MIRQKMIVIQDHCRLHWFPFFRVQKCDQNHFLYPKMQQYFETSDAFALDWSHFLCLMKYDCRLFNEYSLHFRNIEAISVIKF